METPRPHPPFPNLDYVAFTADSQRVIAYDDINGYVWDIGTGQKVATLPGQRGIVHPQNADFILTTRTLINEPYTSTMTLWDSSQHAARWSVDGNIGAFVSPNGEFVGSITEDQIELRNTSTGQLIRNIPTEDGQIILSADGTRLLSADSTDTRIQIWSIPDGKLLQSIALSMSYPTRALTITSDNAFVLVTQGYNYDDTDIDPIPQPEPDEDHAVQVWRIADGELVQRLTLHANSVKTLAISPDGLRLATGSSETTIGIWLYQP